MSENLLIENKIVNITQKLLLEKGMDTRINSGDFIDERGVGLDSISRLTLLTYVEQEFNIEFPEDKWGRATFHSIHEMSLYVESVLNK